MKGYVVTVSAVAMVASSLVLCLCLQFRGYITRNCRHIVGSAWT